MSSRPLLTPFSVMTNASMAGDITSSVTVITNITQISYQAVWSAGSTPVGTLSVQVSNDYSQNADGTVRNAGSWSTATSGSVSGNTGTGFFQLDTTTSHAIRLIYTRASGSGTMNTVIVGKVA